MTLEFINATHSIPQSVIAALHTPEGIIVYGLDFKFDDHQIISPPPDYHRLKELGRKGVLALIVETTRVADSEEVKTPSEKVARIILEDMMRRPLEEKSAMIVTTFSSHIERIQAISDIAKRATGKYFYLKINGKILQPVESMGILKLPENASIFGSPKSVNRALTRAEANRENYLLVTTGHQGEPDALLPRIANGKTQFNVKRGTTSSYPHQSYQIQ